MVDAADEYSYNIDDIRRETDLVEYDLDTLKETDLTSFNFNDTVMSGINDSRATPYISEIKETTLIGDDGDNNVKEIRETNLIGDDINVQEKTLTSSNGHKQKSSSVDSEQWHLDTADSICLSTDSGIINDKAADELDLEDNLTVKFQDIESDFFETDCEATEFESMKHKYQKNTRNELEDIVKFQDIESDFFETDCETTDTLNQKINSNKFETNSGETKDVIKFQDIESEFFETDCETMDSNTTSSTHRAVIKSQDVENDVFEFSNDETIAGEQTSTPKKIKHKIKKQKQQKDPLLTDQANLLVKLKNEKERRVTMTNSLLRSTIDELERALTNSNTLLANRDQKIQDLRKRNTELKKSLSDELEHSAQLKLLVMEKDSVISEKEAKINELSIELDKINKELSDFKLCSGNTSYDFPYDLNRFNDSVETHFIDNPSGPLDGTSSMTPKRSSSCSENKNNKSKCPLARSKSHTLDTPPAQTKHRCTKQSLKQKTPQMTSVESTANSTSKQSNVNETSSTELHARLQMKFMRDAFFYYMIGFHSDEQINAILAILDYGDKRQDFVLEAHKLKKNGKKFNVSKVSTRGLTFVQDIKDI